MKKSLLLFLLIGITQFITAQYTDIINSNRPGFATSPFGIGSHVYQIETGLFYRKTQNKKDESNPRTFGHELSLRFSKYNEKLEFNIDFSYASNRLEFKNKIPNFQIISGFSQATIGAKYLIRKTEYTDKSKEVRSWKKRMAFDKKRLIPSIGVYFGINTPAVDKHYGSEFSPKMALYLQNDLSNRLAVLGNLIIDKLGTQEASYAYIITETYTINDKYSVFIENLGRINVNNVNEFQVAGGLAFLKNKNFQLDASVRFLLEGTTLGGYLSAGLSWRIDKHLENLKIKSDENKVEKILIDKNRDRKAVAKKKGALQHLYRKSKKIRHKKPIKTTKRIKTSKRRIKKIRPPKRRVKKIKTSTKRGKKARTRTSKKRKKGLFAKRTKRIKKGDNNNDNQ